MTFLQQTLGKNYKWWYISLFNFKASSAFIWSDLFYYANQFITAIISIVIWNLNSNSATNETLTYLIFGNILYSLTLLANHWRFSGDIYDGSLSGKLLVPTNSVGFYFFNAMAYSFRQSLVALFYIPILIYFSTKVQFRYEGVIFVVMLIPLIILIKFYFGQIVGAVGFWFKNSYGIMGFSETMLALFSGSLIPLFLFPKFFESTFFAFTLHHPMQIYLGKYSTTEIIYTFVGGIAWCFVLWILARIMFKLGLKRNEAVGL
jgi:ABC-2 type transport system permease protein